MSKRKDLGGFSETDISSGQIIKERGALNMTINTLDLKMHRNLCLERELRFLSSSYKMFTNIKHALGCKGNLKKIFF